MKEQCMLSEESNHISKTWCVCAPKMNKGCQKCIRITIHYLLIIFIHFQRPLHVCIHMSNDIAVLCRKKNVLADMNLYE